MEHIIFRELQVRSNSSNLHSIGDGWTWIWICHMGHFCVDLELRKSRSSLHKVFNPIQIFFDTCIDTRSISFSTTESPWCDSSQYWSIIFCTNQWSTRITSASVFSSFKPSCAEHYFLKKVLDPIICVEKILKKIFKKFLKLNFQISYRFEITFVIGFSTNRIRNKWQVNFL